MKLNEYLKEYRLNNGMNQKAMAKFIGITACSYNRIEKGIHIPTIKTLNKISEALKCTVKALREML